MIIIFYTEATKIGGVTQVISSLVKGLNKMYRTVCIAPHSVMRSPWGSKYAQHKDRILTATFRNQLAGWMEFRTALALRHSFRTIKPDVVHFHLHTPFACQQAILCAHFFTDAKIVVTEHYLSQLRFLRHKTRGFVGSYMRELYIALRIGIKRLVLRWVDHTILLSTGNRELFVETFGKALSSKCSVVFNGIEATSFANGKRVDLEFPESTQIILTIADLNNQKGHRYLIEAIPAILREHPSARFVFAGDGHLRSELEELVVEKGLQNETLFLGRRTDVLELYTTADLVVLPSLFEGSPLTLLEAMSAGKPIVATDIEGTRDIVVNGETGYLVESTNPAALAYAITDLLKNDKRREQMGCLGRERAIALFDAKSMCTKTEHIYLA